MTSNKNNKIVVSQMAPEPRQFFTVKNQVRSLAIGLVGGLVVLLLLSFTLFNELAVASFIRPSQNVEVPPVVNEVGMPVDPSPKISIPKIGVDIPVVYGASTDKKQFELALDQGVVHYPTTMLPGQAGNAAYFGHSSNNIFNPGKYKFAFILLHDLAAGDRFYLSHQGKLYTYEVISKQVVKPTEVSVLGPVAGQMATATLITCDPPGTSTNRLVVVGKQVEPVLAGGSPSQIIQPEPVEPATVDKLPGNGPGLLNRLWRTVSGG